MTKKPKDETLDVPVDFGDVGIDDGTARVGIRIDRGDMNITNADYYLAGSRLRVTVKCDPAAKNDVPGQSVMDGVGGETIKSVADAKSFSTNAKKFGSTLTFKYDDELVGQLAHFAKRSGRLIAERIGDAGKDDEASE